MKLPDIDVVMQAIGQDTSSAPLARLLLELEIGERDLRHYPLKLAGMRFWTDEENTLQLEFKDIGLLADIPYHDLDDGPWVLTSAAFWGPRKSKKNKKEELAYSGPLPCALSFSMLRRHVRGRLDALNAGDAVEMGFDGEVDVWCVGGLELAVDFSGPDDSIRCISLSVPIKRIDRHP
ncbi:MULTISPECIES: hypothetical protein [Stenotrophomonas]|uniref:hypothetical protein n=1 Tax=Stenotrophomonas sp. B2 TaxID=1537778 RepID=UPI0018742607|nr:hypothetical protein [Stenotrophomonas sp. B2]HEL3865640.1 hypothetical protein [Stenotrophomonas maltophilia]MBE5271130.1 hypothetical protein [Stenotrophomonas sp. B2]HEL3866448.1 hypothetical protein [Stenotrophomonas maltophilia]HEL4290565.1 hypothetical protein [Stenotrophomonas maltophilia]HEL4291153.1 hypothetical protein [Stenotrophomonas maltophilia]